MISLNQRELVFISHATPDDNEFTLWLSTRLKLAGYEVWSDVTQLFGGEKFWLDIEQAITDFSCKFVIVITRTSLSKPGVQREVEYALAAEKINQLPNFIIPIIIDDSSFTNQPYELSDRNIIPFENCWAGGFSNLIERFGRDNVPKSQNSPVNLGEYLSEQTNSQTTLREQEDITVSNWLSVDHFPKQLNLFRLPIKAGMFHTRFSDFPYPWFEYSNNFASFCSILDMKKGVYVSEIPSAAPVLDIDDALKGKSDNYPKFEWPDLINKLNFILSDAWSRTMRAKGLHCYTLSNGKEAFFFPDDEPYRGRLNYPDVNGENRRRKILGFSGKNKMFWHYAVEAKALFGNYPKICLIPHVVFTEDGRNPLSDKKKMHRLRRGFCKNWWNARWRDMLLAYLYQVSGGKDSIDLAVGSGSKITLSARPIMLESSVSINLQTLSPDIVDEEDIEVELDGNEEYKDVSS